MLHLYFPIVLIHGFVDSGSAPDKGPLPFVVSLLDEMGVEYFAPQIPPFGSIEERSNILIKKIAERYWNRTVHLFGHSMGGINGRDVAAKAMQYDLGFKVKSVTTFGTPHRGVKWNPLSGLHGTCMFAGVIRSIFGTDFAGVGNLSHEFMARFNKKTANNPAVYYFSWAGKTSVPMANYLDTFGPSRLYGPTDGLVNVDSAEWGHDLGPGTHLGTVRGMNHMTIICHMTILETIAHLQAAEQGQVATVRHIKNGIIQAMGRRIKEQETFR